MSLDGVSPDTQVPVYFYVIFAVFMGLVIASWICKRSMNSCDRRYHHRVDGLPTAEATIHPAIIVDKACVHFTEEVTPDEATITVDAQRVDASRQI